MLEEEQEGQSGREVRVCRGTAEEPSPGWQVGETEELRLALGLDGKQQEAFTTHDHGQCQSFECPQIRNWEFLGNLC